MLRTAVFLVITLAVVSALSPLYRAGAGEEEIEDEYIVKLKDGLSAAQIHNHIRNLLSHPSYGIANNTLFSRYNFHDFHGYHARLSNGKLLFWALNQPEVKYIEANKVINKYDCVSQTGATWGLTRLTLGPGKIPGDLPTDRFYPHNPKGGEGIFAYVIDTGIRISHRDFGGRAIYGADFTNNKNGADDGNGHGTHVAGTIGGSTYGVAKAVTLVAVKVLSDAGSGTLDGVIGGINWVIDHAKKNAARGSVANLSLGGGKSTIIDDAIKALNLSGVAVIVAAGNEGADACNTSPGGSPYAVSVAAADKSDIGAYFTNRGKCVNIIAPGVAVTSAWYESDTDENTISGTSMAAPHVAGIAAVILGNSDSVLTPDELTAALIELAFESTITFPSTTRQYAQAPPCLTK